MILYTQVLPTTNNLALFVRLRSSSFGWFWNQTGTKRNESGTKGNQGEAKRNQSGLKSRISEIVFGNPAIAIRAEPPCVGLHLIDGNVGWVSHLSFVGDCGDGTVVG